MFNHFLYNLKIFAFNRSNKFPRKKREGRKMTKVREKLLECYVRFDPVIRVFLTSRCVLYSVVLTAWAEYGNTGALVNRGGEILQGQTTISNIHEIFFFTDMSYFLETRVLLFKFLQKHFSKQRQWERHVFIF